jgi:uncharacterized protein YjcR
MTQKLQSLIIILLACICFFLFFQKPTVIHNNNQDEIKLLLSKIDSLEEVKAKVDTIYREQKVKVAEVINSRPKTDNIDSLNLHIDTLEYTLMQTITSADDVISNLELIIVKQREIIKLQEEDYESLIDEVDRLSNENKFLKITAAGLVVVSLFLILI